MYWIFSDFIDPLMRSCFYITEGEGRGSEVLFYRKPTWSKLIKLGKLQLEKNFLPIDYYAASNTSDDHYFNNNLINCKKNNFTNTTMKTNVNSTNQYINVKKLINKLPTIRFLPKKTSVRPITNLKSKTSSIKTFKTHFGKAVSSTASTFSNASNNNNNGAIYSNSDLYNSFHVLKNIYNSRPVSSVYFINLYIVYIFI
jgi:hypothetical protein